MDQYIGIVGLAVLLGIAYLASQNRKAIDGRVIAWGLVLQFAFALFVMKVPVGVSILSWVSGAVTELMDKASSGAEFVFGPELAKNQSLGFIFAVKALPIIIFLSSLFAVLYYIGLLQIIVLAMAKVMARTMGTSGAESLATAANVFMGQTEAPIVIAPYIDKMTNSEVAMLMIGGDGDDLGRCVGRLYRFRSRRTVFVGRERHECARGHRDGKDARSGNG